MTRRKKLKKLSEILKIYSDRLFSGLEEKLSPASFEINSSFRSPRIVFISGYVVFRNSWILEFDEVLEQKGNHAERIKYRYHVMDKNKNLVFRYDNVAHFPDIRTSPHHKHLPEHVIESTAPGLLEIIREIEDFIIKKH